MTHQLVKAANGQHSPTLAMVYFGAQVSQAPPPPPPFSLPAAPPHPRLTHTRLRGLNPAHPCAPVRVECTRLCAFPFGKRCIDCNCDLLTCRCLCVQTCIPKDCGPNISFCRFFLLLCGTYLFRVGLIGVLSKYFKGVMAVTLIYLILTGITGGLRLAFIGVACPFKCYGISADSQ